MNNYVKHILVLFFVAVITYFGHSLVSEKLDLSAQWLKSGYTLRNLYLLAFFSSVAVAVLILIAYRIMPNNVGSVFLVAVSVKVLVFYIYIYKGLKQADDKFLAYNFVVVFFIFLICDVFVAFRALNRGEINT